MTAGVPGCGHLEGGEHRLALRVYYEDTDAAGIVYYANYLRFAERARSEFLRAIGIDQGTLRRETGLVFAVRRVEVDYLRPARLDDAIVVRSRLRDLGAASLVAEQSVEGEAGELARLIVKVACIALDSGRPARIAGALRRALAPYCQQNQRAE